MKQIKPKATPNLYKGKYTYRGIRGLGNYDPIICKKCGHTLKDELVETRLQTLEEVERALPTIAISDNDVDEYAESLAPRERLFFVAGATCGVNKVKQSINKLRDENK